MLIKYIDFENVRDYKECALLVCCNYCDFKCEKENGVECQNRSLIRDTSIQIDYHTLFYNYYSTSPFHKAIIFGGLEPFWQCCDILGFMHWLIEEQGKLELKMTLPEIIIYTGYTEEEANSSPVWRSLIEFYPKYQRLVIKYGRYVCGQKGHYDEGLGVVLASDNQYSVEYHK